MIPGSEGSGTTGPAQGSSDDTIELELTGEQRLAFSEAVGAKPGTVRPDQSTLMSCRPGYDDFASRRAARVDLICNVTCAVAALAIAVVFLWPASDRHRPAPAAISATPLVKVALPVPAVTAAAPVEPQGTPVRIKNAFDSAEVFEFPHGTTMSEARKAVAALLISRARDRRAGGPALRRAGDLQPSRGAAVRQPEDLGTKLVARAKEPPNGPD